MFKHDATYFLLALGILGFLFAFVRTLFLVRRQSQERKEAMIRAREAAKRLNDLTTGKRGEGIDGADR